jgi:hypothetical protein
MSRSFVLSAEHVTIEHTIMCKAARRTRTVQVGCSQLWRMLRRLLRFSNRAVAPNAALCAPAARFVSPSQLAPDAAFVIHMLANACLPCTGWINGPVAMCRSQNSKLTDIDKLSLSNVQPNRHAPPLRWHQVQGVWSLFGYLLQLACSAAHLPVSGPHAVRHLQQTSQSSGLRTSFLLAVAPRYIRHACVL